LTRDIGFVRVLRHPSQYWDWLLLFAALIFSLIMAGILLNRRLTAANIGWSSLPSAALRKFRTL